MLEKVFSRSQFSFFFPSLALRAGMAASIVIAGLTAGRTSGQDSRPPSGEAVKEFGKAAPPSSDSMYEDVEIFRRILHRQLELMYPINRNEPSWSSVTNANNALLHRYEQPFIGLTPSGTIYERNLVTPDLKYWNTDLSSVYLNGVLNTSQAANTWWTGLNQPSPSPRPAIQLEGVYLKGQGVVFTTTLPHHGKVAEDPHSGKLLPMSACTKCHEPSFSKRVEETFQTAQKMPSLWEQTRREVRGVKEEQKPAPAKHKDLEVCGPGTVGEAVLHLLAEQGRHFSHLADSENLTVVVTFRGGEEPRAAKATDAAANASKTSNDSNQRPQNPLEDKLRTTEGAPANPSSARDYELLGDLHLKQNRHEDAVKAFQKAIDQKPEPKQMAALYRKLAQAYLNMEKDAQAQEAVRKAVEWLRKHQEATAKAPQSNPPAAARPLPAKLIISAPKKLLDLAGSGKISFEEFKKAATVEYLTFPAPTAKSAQNPRQ